MITKPIVLYLAVLIEVVVWCLCIVGMDGINVRVKSPSDTVESVEKMEKKYFQGLTKESSGASYDEVTNIYFTLSAAGTKNVITTYSSSGSSKVASSATTGTSIDKFKDCGDETYSNTKYDTFTRRRQLSAVQEITTTAADKEAAARAEEKMKMIPHTQQHQHRGLADSFDFCDDIAPECQGNGNYAAAGFVLSFIVALALIVLQFMRAGRSDNLVISWATILLHVFVMIFTASSVNAFSRNCVADYLVELNKIENASGSSEYTLMNGPVMIATIAASVLSFIQVIINILFRYERPPLALGVVDDNINKA